jgi:MFS transporter, DHA1 family, tetracycline resistance protein
MGVASSSSTTSIGSTLPAYTLTDEQDDGSGSPLSSSPTLSSSHDNNNINDLDDLRTKTATIMTDDETVNTTNASTPPPLLPPPITVRRRRSSWWDNYFPSRLQQVDIDERPARLSVYRRPSFVHDFWQSRGPPQIAVLMVLIAMGLGCTIGVVPAVMSDRFARLYHGWEGDDCSSRLNSSTNHIATAFTSMPPLPCIQGSADAQTAVATSHLISNAFTFLTSSVLGSWSDQHGRKPLLLAGLAVGCIPPFLLWLVQVLPHMSPWWYYGMSASTGLFNWVAVAFSALADVLPPTVRAPGIGLLMAGFMLGFSLAPLLAWLLSAQQLSLVSFLTVLVGLLGTILFVPETLPPDLAAEARQRRLEQQQQQDLYRDDPSNSSFFYFFLDSSFVRSLRRFLWRPFHEMSILNRNTFFRLISSLAFFSGMVSSGDQVLLVYYLEERLGFTSRDVSTMFLVLGCMGLIAQGFLLKPLSDTLGEKYVVALAFLCGAVDNAMYGLAQNKTTIFVAVGVAGLTGMAFPTISAIKANNVEPSEQGRIQGALYSLQALASGLGPITLKFVYSQTKHSELGPGCMFVFASGLYLIAVCIACSLPNDKANAARRVVSTANIPSDGGHSMPLLTAQQDLDEEYMPLASDSSASDEDDHYYDYYGTMAAATTTTLEQHKEV